MIKKKIAIIGAGASGCFAAINIAEKNKNVEITIFESGTPLHKLSLTGAGRCNITNTFETDLPMIKFYPRGDKLLKNLFYTFNKYNTIEWFENHGIKLYAQNDGRVFPTSNKAIDVVNLLLNTIKKYNIKIKNFNVETIEKNSENKFKLLLSNKEYFSETFDYVIVSIGGTSNNALKQLLKNFDIEINTLVPSLFSFKIKSNVLTALSGLSVENVSVAIAGEKFKSEGGLLITHFGMSGPAILKLSSYAAIFLAENNYKCNLIVNWLNSSEQDILLIINNLIKQNGNKNVISAHPKYFTKRLWEFIVNRAEISAETKYNQLGKKNINKLVSILMSDSYHVSGRGQFNEEFVTCGGVKLNSINPKTLEAKNVENLFFTGEVLDIDGITGGFNLQSAWTTGYVVAQNDF